jgi:hypothetical protein
MKKKQVIKVGDYVLIVKPDAITIGDDYFTAGKNKVAKVIYIRKYQSCQYRVEFIEKIRAVTIYSRDEIKKLTGVERFMEML